MADKIIKITLEQLNDIVSDAVTNAIKKLENVEIIEDTPKESSSTVPSFKKPPTGTSVRLGMTKYFYIN